MKRYRLLIIALVALTLVAFFISGAHDALTLDMLKAQQARFQSGFERSPWTVAGGYFLLYVLITGLGLPGATLLTLLGGALLGLAWGLPLVSFASAIGATLAFLLSRTLFRDSVERHFRRPLAVVNRGLEREGGLYLFSLRLVPLFPFFVINLVMGVTRLKTPTFYLASQAGMLPATLVYVNAGQQLGELNSVSGVLSPDLLLSFALLGLFPLVAKKTADSLHRRKAWQGHRRPRTFDYDIVVIGAGSAGLVASYIASTLNARVALVEKARMGGDCLNTGCVPSKALIRAARAAQDVRTAHRFGVHGGTGGEPRIDFAAVMAHVRGAIRDVAPHDSIERYTELGVEVIGGQARLETPWVVRVGEQRLVTRHIVIATGARPKVPRLPGVEQVHVLTSENLWELEALPERLVILGGGNIGCELGQSFARLGSRVTLIVRGSRLLAKEDAEVGEQVQRQLAGEGIDIRTDTQAVAVEADDSGNHRLLVEHVGQQEALVFDRLLIATGRQANVSDLGLEELGIVTTGKGTVDVNETLQTRYPNIWACGDVSGPYQLTHAGSHQAWHATVNALFGEFRTFRVDYRVMPAVTFAQPEVARVGLNEQEARAQGIDYEVTRYAMAENDRALAERATEGFVKVLTVTGKDRILGVTLVGENAGEWLAEFTLAMRHGIGLNKLLSTIHPYPTLSEANKAVAGQWKHAHKPERLLRWLARYFAWRRH